VTTYIKFNVSVARENIGGEYEDDSWSRDSYIGSCSILSAKIVKDDGYDTLAVAEDLKAGAIIFLVWAEYTTGDSFGSDGGNYELLQVFTDADSAVASRMFYENDTRSYHPWQGYFESLDGIFVETMILGV